MTIKLQVALDQTRLKDALRIARDASEVGANILEVGTPLIKSEGLNAIKKLRQTFPKKIIVADMKTMNIGYLETKIAIEAGADMVSILGVASNQTIKEAIKSVKENGGKLMIDLMDVENKVGRAKELEKLGADYIIYHLGIDENEKIKNHLKVLKSVIESVNIPVVVGGGINDKNIDLIINLKIDTIIVGRFITDNTNPKLATKLMLSAITSN